jgi:dihydroorotate dehydrogenase
MSLTKTFQMYEQQKTKVDFKDHEYARTMGDRFLSLTKKMISNPERRHELLPILAKTCRFIPGHRSESRSQLEHVIKFNDRSNPLYLGGPVLMAAGLNKFAKNIPDYARLGYGGLIVGTATRQSREGNTFRPRIKMLEEDFGIQNAMGLNNPGIAHIAHLVDRDLIRAHKSNLSVGISVAETPGIEDEGERLEDCIYTFRKAYNAADFVEINVSCPNTGHKKTEENLCFLDRLFSQIMQIRKNLPVRKAIYAKLSPDMNQKQMHSTLELLKDKGINGVSLFNTFPAAKSQYLKLKTKTDPLSGSIAGGLSGRPLYLNTFRAVQFIKKNYPEFSVIACGGVDHGAKVWDLLRCGADAVECYSVIAFRWMAIRKINLELRNCLHKDGFKSLQEFFEKHKS